MTDQRVDGRATRFQHRRGELLEAIVDYVLLHGASQLSLRPLAEAVGVSHVTLRHHFGTKEELVAEVFTEIRKREPVPLVQGLDGEHILRALWERWSEEDGARLFRLMFEAYGQALVHPHRYPRFLDSVVSDWIGRIAAVARASGCPDEEAERFATMILAQFRGLQLDLLATGERERVEDAFEGVLEYVRELHARWASLP